MLPGTAQYTESKTEREREKERQKQNVKEAGKLLVRKGESCQEHAAD